MRCFIKWLRSKNPPASLRSRPPFSKGVKYFAIIPAAGIGTRFKSDTPKQYLKIHNQTILERVVNLFSSHPLIEKVIVVLHEQDRWWKTLTIKNAEKILTVIGGKERVNSVLSGLFVLNNIADKDDFIIVHDAARPCLKFDDISRLMTAIKDHPVGGLLGLPVVDTLKKINAQNEVIATISRDHLWQAQTPQCFRFQILKSAIEKSLLENNIITDESSALEYAGYHPKMILGDARNIKITFMEDLRLLDRE